MADNKRIFRILKTIMLLSDPSYTCFSVFGCLTFTAHLTRRLKD